MIKMFLISKRLFWYANREGRKITLGELSRVSGLPKSTCRRIIDKMEKRGLIDWEFDEYKSTGKYTYALTEIGIEFYLSQKSFGWDE